MTEARPDWDTYFLTIARTVAGRADCRRRQVGAVIVDADHRIIATGYNGAPAGHRGCLEGACPRGLASTETIAAYSSYDNCIAIHAEANALLYARTSCQDATVYITDAPCSECRKLLAGAGVGQVTYPEHERLTGMTPAPYDPALATLDEAARLMRTHAAAGDAPWTPALTAALADLLAVMIESETNSRLLAIKVARLYLTAPEAPRPALAREGR